MSPLCGHIYKDFNRIYELMKTYYKMKKTWARAEVKAAKDGTDESAIKPQSKRALIPIFLDPEDSKESLNDVEEVVRSTVYPW
ncbi:hypothetical protein MMC06_000981 [Schaereria dolodes]|nr:hypothetical protein [Schaereria dolodes]